MEETTYTILESLRGEVKLATKGGVYLRHSPPWEAPHLLDHPALAGLGERERDALWLYTRNRRAGEADGNAQYPERLRILAALGLR